MILLTGGAGFIGSCFLKTLNDNGIKDVVIVDHLGRSNKWKNLVGKHFHSFFSKEQFLDLIKTKRLTNFKFNAIIHLGACTNTTETNLDYLIQNNFQYSVTLAELALHSNARFIYASSAATYGLGDLGYDDDLCFELKPLNPYGFSKYLFDCWVYENSLQSTFVGLKLFNVYGPNEYHKGEMSSMVFKAFNQVQNSGRIRLFKSIHASYADGEQKRDFIYVFDVLDILWKLLNSKIAGIFNLGSGVARSWNELALAVFSALQKEPIIDYIDMPDTLKPQYQNFTQAKMDKLRNALGALSFTSLEEGVFDYIQNFLLKDWKNY
ncbi:MAG: ADP-glyceromanno-heptose 6-epimerase [Candidatus Kapaibacteriales bacterium]